MKFMKKVTQRLRRLHRPVPRQAGFATTDLLIGSAGFVILSVAVVGASVTALNEMRYGPAQSQAQTIGSAIAKFYTDTGKWPGQVEQAAGKGAQSKTVLLASDMSNLPEIAEFGLTYPGAACEANSLAGFVSESFSGITTAKVTDTIATNGPDFEVHDLKNFLVNNPGASYPGWGGKSGQGYATEADILQDSWGKSWIVYLLPLMCSEDVSKTAIADDPLTSVDESVAATAAGGLGYAWVLSGGSNQTITTDLDDLALDPFGDDAGSLLGKLSPTAVE